MVELVSGGRVREEIERMPLLAVEKLEEGSGDPESLYKNLRLAHLQLTTLMAAFVWSEGDARVPILNYLLPFFHTYVY